MRFTFTIFFIALSLMYVVSTSSPAQIQIGRPKEQPPLDNPYTLNLPRADVTKAVQELLQTCGIEMDAETSKADKGKFVTKPWVFARGLNTKQNLEYVSHLPASDARNWLKGRYSLEINVLPLDDKRAQLQIISRIQGQVADVAGTKWIESPSNGRIEDEVLRGIAGKILGLDLNPKPNMKRRLMGCEF